MQFLASTFVAAATSGGSPVPDIDVVGVGGVTLATLAALSLVEHLPTRTKGTGNVKVNLLTPSQRAAFACLLSLGTFERAFGLLMPEKTKKKSRTGGKKEQQKQQRHGEQITAAVQRVNKIIWMRACLAIRRWLLATQGKVGGFLAWAALHSVIASTFYGCTIYPKHSNQTIFKMFRLFVGHDIFDAAEARKLSTIGELATVQRALQVSSNAFIKLLPFNMATNLAVLVVGAAMSGKLPPREKVIQIIQGCLIMNTAVSASSGVYVSTFGMVARTIAHWKDKDAAVRASALAAAMAMPAILVFVKDAMVRDALSAMFGQWSMTLLLRRVHVPAGPMLVTGAYLGTSFAQHGGNGWLMQVVLGAVQKRLKSQTEWAKS